MYSLHTEVFPRICGQFKAYVNCLFFGNIEHSQMVKVFHFESGLVIKSVCGYLRHRSVCLQELFVPACKCWQEDRGNVRVSLTDKQD